MLALDPRASIKGSCQDPAMRSQLYCVLTQVQMLLINAIDDQKRSTHRVYHVRHTEAP